ncbi:MFS transporter [Roseicella frigidaeris]|uniref:MFS transporter n=1 Tax=Roseicella frigidaeris TaxID=2230885 RepID=A0A327MLR8_9PROT|nr:MFS transporter [Roseicella frigidaeris]RAI61078.1 MFS transporter [Roseicella frigidaeris]
MTRLRPLRGQAAARPIAALPRYLWLFVLLFLGWGVLSPLLPAVLVARGAAPSEVALLLAIGAGLRLVTMPLAGALADRLGAPRALLAAALLGAALSVLGYAFAWGFVPLLVVGIAHALTTAPVGPLPDALAVREAARHEAGRPRLHYGPVRGAGAAAFILASLGAGKAAEVAGTPVVVLWLNALLFGLAGLAALRLPRPAETPAEAGPPPARLGLAGPGRQAIAATLRLPSFRRLLLVSGLIQGSHAFYAGYAVLEWQAAGLGPVAVSGLWSLSVVAEVAVFFLFGRPLLARLGPGGLCALTALAGVLRWSVMALDGPVPAIALAQLLHGLTFAAQHLAAMAILAQTVPDRLAATAQSLLASLGSGLATTLLLFASGPLHDWLGIGGFWAMAALCALAMPLCRGLGGADRAR